MFARRLRWKLKTRSESEAMKAGDIRLDNVVGSDILFSCSAV